MDDVDSLGFLGRHPERQRPLTVLEYRRLGEAGILVPPKNPGELARAISDLLADKDTLATWRSRSQDKIDFLKIARVSRDTLEVYRSAATNT